MDGGGNLYIADASNHRIRKVDTAGIITTVAGNGTPGYNNDNIAATGANLNYPSGVAVDGSGNLYIVDSSNNRIRKVGTAPPAFFSINNVTANEGNSGPTTFTFTVTRNVGQGAASVDYATSDGTATAGEDYTATNGTVSFADGETSKTFIVSVAGDTVFETTETFNVTLSNPSGAGIATATGVGTITNDDIETSSLVVTTLEDLTLNTDGVTSLREAITYANRTGNTTPETITFAVSGTIKLKSALPTIANGTTTGGTATGPLTISNTQSNGVTISGESVYQIFVSATSANLTLNNLTLSGARGDAAGAIAFTSTGVVLAVNNCTFSGNTQTATGTNGGGAIRFTVTSATSTLTVTNSTFANNTAVNGGAIYVTPATAVTTPVVKISNSTFSGNSATTNGGAISAGTVGAGSIDIRNCTITNNIAGTSGGGIYRTSAWTLYNTIAVGNTATSNPNISTPAPTGGNNLTAGTVAATGLEVDGNDKGVLKDNGGLTQTIALLNRTGLAFNTGSNAGIPSGLTTDQRGTGYPRIQENTVDIGAFELTKPTVTVSSVAVNEGKTGTTTATFTVTLSSPALTGGVTFDITTADGSAKSAEGDYVAKSLTDQTIAAGSRTYSFTVPVNGDTAIETDETFAVNVTVKGTSITTNATATASGTGTITNDDVITAPTATNQSVSTNEDTSALITLAGSDANDDALTFKITSLPTSGKLYDGPGTTLEITAASTATPYVLTAGAKNQVTFVPNANLNGADSFTFKANDGALDSATAATVTLTVVAVNDAPTLNAIGNPTALDLGASQQSVGLSGITSGAANEVQTLTVSATSNNTALIPNPTVSYTSPDTTGTLTYTPVAGQSGSALITVTVGDGGTSPNTFARTFTVAVNEAPIVVTTASDSVPGSATDSDGFTSLREAITAANANSGASTITFSSLFNSAQTITAATALPSITQPLTLTGPGAKLLTVQPQNLGTLEVLTVAASPSVVVSISGLSANGGTVGIFNLGGTLFVDNCSMTGNSDLGLYKLTGTTNGTTTATNCTMAGGSFAAASDGDTTMTLTNCTLSGAENGVYGRVALTSCTVSGNRSYGIYNDGTPKTLKNTIVSGNPTNVSGTYTDGGFNLIGGNANLGTLADNGGPTRTMRPGAGSAALDQGNSFGLTADQRGKVRPYDNPAIANAASGDGSDIGAYEAQLNTAPTASAQSVSTNEDIAKSITLSGSDAEFDPLTYTVVTAPTNGTLSGTGANRTYTPDANFSGTDSFTFKTNDGALDSTPATVTLTIVAVNDAPTDITLSNASVAENEAAGTTVGTLSSTDVDDTTFTYSLVTGTGDTDNASFEIVGNELQTKAAFDFENKASYSVRIQTQDAGTKTFAKAFTLTVTDVAENTAPTATASTTAINEDTPTGLTLSGTDAQNDTLSFKITSLPTSGKLYDGEGTTLEITAASAVAPYVLTVGTKNKVFYVPNANYHGSDSFTFKANDGEFDSAAATATLTITAVNDAPVITSNGGGAAATLSLAENTTAVTTVVATDVDSTNLTYSVHYGKDGGLFAIDATTHAVTFKTAPDFEAPTDGDADNVYEFDVQVYDDHDPIAVVTQTFTLTVTDVSENAAPTGITLSNLTIAENAGANATIGTLAATDPDAGDTLTFSLPAGVDNNSLFNISAATLRASGSFDFETKTSYLVTVRVTDAAGETFDKQFTLAVTDVATTFSIDNVTANEGNTGTTNFEFTVTRSGDTGGTSAVDFDSSDGTGTAGAKVDEDYTAPPAGTYFFAALETSRAITVAVKGDLKVEGNETFNVTLSNPEGATLATATGVGTITNDDSNSVPVANAQSVAVNQDVAKTITLTASDFDDDALTYAVVDAPAHGTLSGTAPNLTYTPTAGYHGADSFTFTASDATETSAPATVSISVNGKPSADAQGLTIIKNTARTVTLTGSDPENDPLTYAVVAPPAHGTLSGTAPNLTYTPSTGYSGADIFIFTVSDGGLTSASARVSINVHNRPPVASPQSVTTAEDTAKNITLVASDADGDTLGYVAGSPDHGTLTGSGPNRIYTPNTNYSGEDSFYFYVSDGKIASPAVLVSITVTAVNDAPVITSNGGGATATLSLAENTTAVTTVVATDVDSTNLTYSIHYGKDGGLFAIDATTHAVTFKTAPDFEAPTDADGDNVYEIDVQVYDDHDPIAVVTQTLSITVTNVAENRAPTNITLSNDSVAENAGANATVGTLSASDSDAGDTFTYSLVTGNGATDNASFEIVGDQLNAKASFDFENKGSYTVRIQTEDAAGLTFDKAFTITVSNVNESPVITTATLASTEVSRAYSQSLSATDPDTGDTLSWSRTSGALPSGITLSSSGVLSGTPTTEGSFNFTLQVSDGHGGTASQAVTLSVTPYVNAAPVITVSAPDNGAVIARNLFLSTLGGSASDDYGVSRASISLFRKKNGANEFWNGTAWGTPQIYVPLQLASAGATTTAWSWSQQAPGDFYLEGGTYGFYVKASDADNAVSALVRRDFILAPAANNTAPVITVSAPDNGATIARNLFLSTLGGSASDDYGVSRASISLFRKKNGANEFWNGTTWVATQVYVPLQLASAGATTTAWSWSQQAPGVANLESGLYGFYVKASDTDSATGAQVRRDFTLSAPSNNNAPVISVSAPDNGAVIPRNLFLSTLGGGVSDDYGVSSASISLFRKKNGVNEFWNGTAWTATQTYVALQLDSAGSPTTDWSWPTMPSLESGTYGFYVKASDVDNLTSVLVRRDFTLAAATNATSLTINVSAPKNGAVIARNLFLSKLSGTATDDKGVSRASISLFRKRNGANEFWNGTTWVATQVYVPLQLASPGATSTSWNWSQQAPGVGNLDLGLYGLYVKAQDAGNATSTQVRRDFTLSIPSNNTTPVITVSAPDNGAVIARNLFLSTLGGSVSDDYGVSGASIMLFRKINGVYEFWNGTAWGSAQIYVALQLDSAGATASGWSWSQQAPSLSDLESGTYGFYVKATDVDNVTGTLVRRDFSLGASSSAIQSRKSSSAPAF